MIIIGRTIKSTMFSGREKSTDPSGAFGERLDFWANAALGKDSRSREKVKF